VSQRSWIRQVDFGFVALLFLLSGLGLIVLWSASHGPEGYVSGYVGRQLRWMALGIGVMVCAAALDYRRLQKYAGLLYVANVGMLVLVLLAGRMSMGARRWLSLGWFSLQPSELMKITVVITVACLLARERSAPPHGVRQLLLPAATTALPLGLILFQPDLGTSLLLGAVLSALVFFQGVRRKLLMGVCCALLAAAPVGWGFLHEYQRQRVRTFLNPESDPLGAGYHIIQSKIAVGSGQLLGKGYLKGTQVHLQFLPERHTDFIFSVLAEEWGFLGCMAVLSLYALLVLWGLDIAAKARDSFGRLLAVGVTAILFFQVVVNVGMVTGMLPVVGLPLPLFSYGGSSVLTTYAISGILLSIRIRRFSRAF
jgi:rod shape determining protein RodA